MIFFLYKPFGMLSQFTPDHPGQQTLADLDYAFPKQAYPVGRLDADSEGLLLLSDDPSLNARLLLPQNHVQKTYWAQVEGIPDESALENLRRGVSLQIKGETQRTRAAKVRLLETEPSLPPREPPVRFRKSIPDCWLEICLTEGKNRQVRRMCAAVGYPVLRLVRAAIGPYHLEEAPLQNLGPGEVRTLPRWE